MPSTKSRSTKTSTPCCTPFMKSPTAECEPIPANQPPARPWWRGLRLLLVAYLIVVLGMTFLEASLVYPIPPLGRGDWPPAGLNFEDVWFHSPDGTKLHGW